jgi:D-alanyl-D-alanine carboxypeptidase
MAATVLRHQRLHFARHRVVAVLAAVALLTAALVVPGLAQWAHVEWPHQPAAPAGLPACRTAELPASHAGYDEWADTLLDPANTLPEDYEPPDLVARQLSSGNVRLRSFVIADLVALLDSAASDGVPLTITSSYRSFASQRTLFRDLATNQGTGYAREFAARPGHSEHQLGTAVDLGGGDDWLAANAWRYGFVMSYPASRSPTWTCYGSEPWHYRYFGKERAAAIHASGLSPREWLWQLHSGS